MADSFYPFTKQEAKEDGVLDRWEQSHRINVRCARDIDRLIASHTQNGQMEEDCARAALDWWGLRRVQFVLSNTLHGTSSRRFDQDSIRWVRTAYVPYDKTNVEFKVQADISLLAQFVQQTYAEYQGLGMFGPKHCGAPDQDYTGKVLVLRPDRLREDCWFAQNQLWYGLAGFGLSPASRGRAVFATCLGDGEKARWNRDDFMGVLDEQYLPDWAMERLAELRAPAQEQAAATDPEQAEAPAQGGMEMG